MTTSARPMHSGLDLQWVDIRPKNDLLGNVQRGGASTTERVRIR